MKTSDLIKILGKLRYLKKNKSKLKYLDFLNKMIEKCKMRMFNFSEV